jgi:hypothetical protein
VTEWVFLNHSKNKVIVLYQTKRFYIYVLKNNFKKGTKNAKQNVLLFIRRNTKHRSWGSEISQLRHGRVKKIFSI